MEGSPALVYFIVAAHPKKTKHVGLMVAPQKKPFGLLRGTWMSVGLHVQHSMANLSKSYINRHYSYPCLVP